MNKKEQEAAWLKKMNAETDAAVNTCRQILTNHENARNAQKKADKEQEKWKKKNPEPTSLITCNCCSTISKVKGYVNNLIGTQIVCTGCSRVLTIYVDPVEQQRRIDRLNEIDRQYAQDNVAREEARLGFWGTIGTIALGVYIGSQLGHKMFENNE